MKLSGMQEVDVVRNNLMKQWTLPDSAILLAVFCYINSNSIEDDCCFASP